MSHHHRRELIPHPGPPPIALALMLAALATLIAIILTTH